MTTINGPTGLTTDPVLARFSTNLTRLRTARKVSRAALAHQIGASAKALEHWEAGTGNPQLRYLVLLADFFGLSVDDMLGVSKGPDEDRSRLGLLLKYHQQLDAMDQRLQKLEKAREHSNH